MNTEAADSVPLVSRAVPCTICRGRGALPAVGCFLCLYHARISRAEPAWYLQADLAQAEVFPGCGHSMDAVRLIPAEVVCPACGGTGEMLSWKTARAWAKQDQSAARRNKQECSDMAQVAHDNWKALGYSRRSLRCFLGLMRPRCGAHSRRSGLPCTNRVVLGKMRCRLHGGCSTGPKTAEGKAHISQSNRTRQSRPRRRQDISPAAGNEPQPPPSTLPSPNLDTPSRKNFL